MSICSDLSKQMYSIIGWAPILLIQLFNTLHDRIDALLHFQKLDFCIRACILSVFKYKLAIQAELLLFCRIRLTSNAFFKPIIFPLR